MKAIVTILYSSFMWNFMCLNYYYISVFMNRIVDPQQTPFVEHLWKKYGYKLDISIYNNSSDSELLIIGTWGNLKHVSISGKTL